ncbi:MAG: phosphoglucosamine mutase [Acidobacteria bacterium]|nr:phosphoglucosamine mutase [Acidobacteriota bacterium]
MEKKLFGTDGIRGVAGQYPLDSPTTFAVGRCLGQYLLRKFPQPSVILGEDTRESGRWIAEMVAAGLHEAGVKTYSVGVITTPGLAYLTVSQGFDAGIMISASHNPYQDNGIKVFAASGYKLPDEEEMALERDIFQALSRPSDGNPVPLILQPDRALIGSYMQHLRRAAAVSDWNLAGRKLVVDCANGSAAAIAGEVFSGLGLQLVPIADQPDGRNINLRCGSLHLENLREAVLREKADLGVSFDGDADRALFVAATGKFVDGDGILLLASRYMRRKGTLKGDVVIGTVMANLGLENALACEGLRLLRTPVGDKYVLEEMQRVGGNLGGEQSGHIIFSELATTGDGLLTALQVLRIMAEEQRTLEQLVEGLSVFPQTIRNVRVRQRVPLENLPPVQEQILASQQCLGNSGRILVRYSGTELLVRVMVEAASAEEVEQHASALVRVIQENIGAAPLSAG